MKPIAILGGAFDPVTVGHIDLVQLIEGLGFEVICMPCGDRHSFGKRMLPASDRIEMLKLAIGSRRICDVEIERGTFRAAETYPLLVARYGSVHWVIGSDNANCMERWHDGERLKGAIPFIVVARFGQPLTQQGAWCLKAPHRYVETGLNREISSTIARTAVAQGEWEKAATVIPVEVLELIRTRGWYSAREASETALANNAHIR